MEDSCGNLVSCLLSGSLNKFLQHPLWIDVILLRVGAFGFRLLAWHGVLWEKVYYHIWQRSRVGDESHLMDLFSGCLLRVSEIFIDLCSLIWQRSWIHPLCSKFGRIFMADLVLLRTLQFPLGSPDSGHLKPIKGKGGFSQWIVINYSPYSSHLKRSCFL